MSVIKQAVELFEQQPWCNEYREEKQRQGDEGVDLRFPKNWINEAFCWERSLRGPLYWFRIEQQWLDILRKNGI